MVNIAVVSPVALNPLPRTARLVGTLAFEHVIEDAATVKINATLLVGAA